MSELRQNLANKEWVIIAPERLKGKSLSSRLEPPPELPEYSDGCPFCPGNEERFPNIEIERIQDGTGVWKVLCVENKYKIFAPHSICPLQPTEFEDDGIYHRFQGCGNHELVIESAKHNNCFARMALSEIEDVVRMYIGRFQKLGNNPNNLLTMIFKNHGNLSGASQKHPHTQIVSMRVVPNYVRFLLDEARRYFDNNGICVFCKMIDFEIESGRRIVCENERFVALTPYASMSAYELQILPKKHDALFSDMDEPEISDFAACLRVCMKKLCGALSNPDFNMVLRNPPYRLSGVPFYHWHLQIIPRIGTSGGFEQGSRMNVNVVYPEAAAEDLRSM